MTALESRARIAPPYRPAVAVGQLRARHAGRRTLRALAYVLPPVLFGYALLDRGFAYIHIPGTPIFLGEIVVMVCLAAALVATGYIHRGLERSAIAKLLLAFAAWGLARTLPNLGAFGVDALRDAALWYYALVAIPVCALVLSDPALLRRWARGYRRFIPWLLLWSPVALFLAKKANDGWAPKVPGSAISIFDHKGANVSIHVTIALAFLWLVPGVAGRFRTVLTGMATLVLLIGATQGRSGFVAAAAGLAMVWWFAGERGRMAPAMLATVLLVVIVGWGFNIHITGDQGRSISVEQLAQNLASVVGGHSANAPGNLDANVRFRDQLWSATLHKVETERKVLTGLGFGPNIAKEVGFEGQGPVRLRSPHNSHLDIYARMGLIGVTLWIALWSAFGATALRARSRFRVLGRRFETGLVEVSMVGVTAILINSYFDPTLESPQVALWLWTLVGLTLGLVAVARRASAPPAVPRSSSVLIARR